ncbi:MAG: hypothetical protein D6826_00970, partial [Alphaproteobacteria bacterium]
MSSSAIGSIGAFGPGGRLGLVIGRQVIGARDEEGRALVALRVRSFEPVRPEQAGAGARAVTSAPVTPASASVLPSSAAASIEPGRHRPGPVAAAGARTPERLSPEEKAVVDRLRQRDAQVRQEEQAHAAAAGDLAGAIEYVYRTGPDGRRYAVGGAVPIRSRVLNGDPAEAAQLGARLAAAGQAATNP